LESFPTKQDESEASGQKSTSSKKQDLSLYGVLIWLFSFNSDFYFKVKTISAGISPFVDTVSDILLAGEWFRQGHIYWPALMLICIFLGSAVQFAIRFKATPKKYRTVSSMLGYGLVCLFGLGTATWVPRLVRCRILEESREYEDNMEGFLIFKVLEAVCEAGPALLLNSYTMALSLLTVEKAPEVVPLTWVGFIVSVVTFSYAIISLHIESVGVTSWRSLYLLSFFLCSTS